MFYSTKKVSLAATIFLAVGATKSIAAPITYYFGGVITTVEPNECDIVACTPSLVGPGASAIGMTFTGNYSLMRHGPNIIQT
jgi:hypothetical protein